MRPISKVGLFALASLGACPARDGIRASTEAPDSRLSADAQDAQVANALPVGTIQEAGLVDAPAPTHCEAGADCTIRGKQAFDAKRYVEAHALFERACELNDALGCKWLALDLKDANDPRIRVDPARVAPVMQKACDLGELEACWILGNGYLYGNRSGVLNPDPEHAVRLYEKGCAGGEAASCASLADCYEAGEGAPKNKVLARRYRKRAEELGYVGE